MEDYLKHVRHGHTRGARGATVRTPTYNSWRAMVSRCTCETDTAYPNYGGKGVTVCDRWRTFANFIEDMGERPPGKTLDRIDNTKGYWPDNCRWAGLKAQSRNRSTTRVFLVEGLSKTVGEWSRALDCNVKSLENRLYRRGEESLKAWIAERLVAANG